MPAFNRHRLDQIAHELGFEAVRVAALHRPTPGIDVYDAWIAAGKHGEMHYLSRGRDLRADPSARLTTARTAVVFTEHHHYDRPPDPGGRTGMVARYAWGRDYHNLMGKRLKKLRRELGREGVSCWGGVDAAPILERSWARLAGVGFLGKNTLTIEPSRGSWFFLAVMFLDVELPPDEPLPREYCGRCTRCLDACPTDAFPTPWSLDARRCISYWTIEARGLPPRDLRHGFGRWLFGCDVCQDVCPHNHSPKHSAHHDLRPRNAWIDLDGLVLSEDAALLDRFEGTPLRRPGPVGLKRNALLCLGNLGDPEGAEAASAALSHPDETVRGAAVWALRQLNVAHRLPTSDPSPVVQAELDAPNIHEVDP